MRTMMSSSRRYKAQVAFEYMFIFGIFMVAIIIGTAFAWTKSIEVENYMTRLEVDGLEGLKDVAAVYAIFESSLAGRAVTMGEVESGELYAYQEEIDAALGVS